MANEVCKPNISAAGRRRRRVVGWVGVAAGVAALGAGAVLHWPWYVRAGAVFVPAALAAVGFLQATRATCIARASEGTFENEDFSTTAAPPDEVAASRKVAAGIRRDAVLIGLLSAAVAAATALI